MAIPGTIARLTNFLTDVWEAARAKVNQELNQLVGIVNAIIAAMNELQQENTALDTRLDEIDTQPYGMRRGLRIIQSPTSPQTDFRVVMDRFALSDGTTVLEDVDVLIDIGDSGAGGLDTGAITPGSFYYVHICHDSTGLMSPETVGVVSLSPTPTLPTGYDKYGLVDKVPFILTDSNGQLVAFSQIPNSETIMYYSWENDGPTDTVTLNSDSTVWPNWRSADISALVPAGAAGAWCMFRYDGTAGGAGTYHFRVRPNWGSPATGGASSQRHIFSGNAADHYFGPFWIPLDEDGVFLYITDDDGATPATVLVWVVGIQLGSKE